MLGDLMSSVSIEVKVFETTKRTTKNSETSSSNCRKTEGTADVFDGIVSAGPSISVTPKYNQLSQYGITPANLQFQLQTLLEEMLLVLF
jgi:Cu/Ag efflux pump CusA